MALGFQLYRRSSKATRQHFHHLGAAGWSYQDIARALSAATTMQTTSELLSSVEMGERETARVEKRSDSAEKRLDAIAAKYGAKGYFSGDPRGCPLLIRPDCNLTDGSNKVAPEGLPNTGWCGGYCID